MVVCEQLQLEQQTKSLHVHNTGIITPVSIRLLALPLPAYGQHGHYCGWFQVEQRKLREAAAAMAAELLTLRHHMAMLTSPTPGPTPNGMPPRRTSPNGLGPPPSARMAPDPADLLSAATSGSLGITKVCCCPGAVHGRL